jgi:GntR family transcriptional repressor for pyruvate dehydrogenase complex
VNGSRTGTLVETLLVQLRGQILSGRLQPGEPLPTEREIGEAFGVGRSTVREALGSLVASGFAERRGRHIVVRDPTLVASEEVDLAALAARLSAREVFATRKLLEVDAARLAARNRTQADVEHLRGVVAAMQTLDPEQYHERDIEFHRGVVAAAGNRVVQEIYDSSIHLFFKLPAFWRVFGSRGKPAAPVGGGAHGHQVLLDAIEAGDEDAAAAEMFDHLDRVERNLVARISTARTDRGTTETRPARGRVGTTTRNPE